VAWGCVGVGIGGSGGVDITRRETAGCERE